MIHLIIQYCNDGRPERAAEYDECVRRNLAHPLIASLHNLVETNTNVPDAFRSHPKYVEHVLGRWMTYRDAFDYANARLKDKVVCIANLDIFLDPASNWREACDIVNSQIVLCLSRIEWNIDGTTFRDPGFERLAFANTQDAWLFRTPIEVPNCDFEIGTLGCDNAIAHRIKQANRIPVNAGNRFRIMHYDRARGKTSGNQQAVHDADRVARPRRRPEEEGQYLLPDIDLAKSVDQILSGLNVSDIDRYTVVCDVMSRFLRVRNK